MAACSTLLHLLPLGIWSLNVPNLNGDSVFEFVSTSASPSVESVEVEDQHLGAFRELLDWSWRNLG